LLPSSQSSSVPSDALSSVATESPTIVSLWLLHWSCAHN
jgi:hypothetical protein